MRDLPVQGPVPLKIYPCAGQEPDHGRLVKQVTVDAPVGKLGHRLIRYPEGLCYSPGD